MKTLQQHLNEALKVEQKIDLPGALSDEELIEWAAKLDPKKIDYTKDLEDDYWLEFDNHYIDPNMLQDKKYQKVFADFCDLCKKIVKSKISMNTVELGNWYGFGEDEDPQYTADEMGASSGDDVFHHCTDGDDGSFFIAVASSPADKKLLKQLLDITMDGRGWDPEIDTVPEFDDENW